MFKPYTIPEFWQKHEDVATVLWIQASSEQTEIQDQGISSGEEDVDVNFDGQHSSNDASGESSNDDEATMMDNKFNLLASLE